MRAPIRIVTARAPHRARHTRHASAAALSALVLLACGGDERPSVTINLSDDDDRQDGGGQLTTPSPHCDEVEIDGDTVIEHEQDFTARFAKGEPYTKTVMLFGGDAIEGENKLSNAFIFALDREDALRLAMKYPDFHLCSSEGGQEASQHIVPYDLVPANCKVYDELLAAFSQLRRNDVAGGDRTSLRIEGSPLTLVSVTANATGQDVTDQVHDQDFQLVTDVEQLTGQSVLEFGTTN
jgi:hypothetical protein